MIAALSTGHKVGLIVVAAIFIVFALASAFVLPRRSPDYPGKRLGLFIGITVALFVAMLAAVIVFGAEPKAEGGGKTKAAETTKGETTAEPASGDAVAGKQVFLSAGCVSCHTLKDAGSTGTVGPNLDQAKPQKARILDRVTHGKGPMPPFKGQLSDEQIANVVAYVYSATHT